MPSGTSSRMNPIGRKSSAANAEGRQSLKNPLVYRHGKLSIAAKPAQEAKTCLTGARLTTEKTVASQLLGERKRGEVITGRSGINFKIAECHRGGALGLISRRRRKGYSAAVASLVQHDNVKTPGGGGRQAKNEVEVLIFDNKDRVHSAREAGYDRKEKGAAVKRIKTEKICMGPYWN